MDGATAERPAAVEQPQTPVQGAGDQTRATTHGNLVDEAARVAATLNDKLPTLSQETRLTGANRRGSTEAARETQAQESREEFDAPHAQAAHAHAAGSAEGTEDAAAMATPVQAEARGGRVLQRAASVGASVGENLRPRVEKLREASTVVFDEASDDPGLRFVIIAALLFLLFLFILLFSYILG
jgi:nucleoid-associated protein YgaU